MTSRREWLSWITVRLHDLVLMSEFLVLTIRQVCKLDIGRMRHFGHILSRSRFCEECVPTEKEDRAGDSD